MNQSGSSPRFMSCPNRWVPLPWCCSTRLERIAHLSRLKVKVGILPVAMLIWRYLGRLDWAEGGWVGSWVGCGTKWWSSSRPNKNCGARKPSLILNGKKWVGKKESSFTNVWYPSCFWCTNAGRVCLGLGWNEPKTSWRLVLIGIVMGHGLTPLACSSGRGILKSRVFCSFLT